MVRGGAGTAPSMNIFFAASFLLRCNAPLRTRTSSPTFSTAKSNARDLAQECDPFNDWGGAGSSNFVPAFGRGRHENSPYRGHIWPTPRWNEFSSGEACQPCRGSCSPIPGRGCFGNLHGDGIVVSPPSPIVEQLMCAVRGVGDAVCRCLVQCTAVVARLRTDDDDSC